MVNKPPGNKAREAKTVLDSAAKLWEAAQESLKKVLNPQIYQLWFAPIKPVSLQDNQLTLKVADGFTELWIKENYLDLMKKALAHVSGQMLEIVFEVDASMAQATPAPEEQKAEVKKPVARSRAHGDGGNGQPAELPFNPKNTFETFVVGNNNIMAHGAALAVAQSPGKTYNPLFLYGGVGLGKTHLLHAIGQYVTAHKPHAHVAYVSSEKFTNEFIDAIQSGSLARFRKKYRLTDLLLIDDIQFLAGKERIQEEFFHTFNALYESRKQIVLACDRPPKEISGLQDRLISRFEWGMVSDLQPPDVETRLAILRKKRAMMGAELSDELLEFIARNIRSNIRRLEGALVRVIGYTSLSGKPLTIEAAREMLRELLEEEQQPVITIETIQRRVAEHFDVRLVDMTSRRRPENIAFPRQVAMYLARNLTGAALKTIGEAFGGRDHGTVLHACKVVKDRMDVDPNSRKMVEMIERSLRG
jgi:chromosomal replication initiator protein